jgi:aminoglycoside phosphotransferase (APT) family kinase protein
MMNPWDPDRSLTMDTASRAINSRFPTIDTQDLAHLGSGWEFDAWLTKDGWVFRFPRRAGLEDLIESERRVHKLLRSFLPPGVSIPRVERVGQPSADFPYRFPAHRFIPGVPVDEVDAAFLPSLARQIGSVLGAIHAIPEAEARSAGVVEMDVDDEGRREWVEQRMDALSALGGIDPIVDGAVQWVRQVSLPVVRCEGPLTFIHHDLSPEHLLVDPATGQLTGILDWTDAILGDAARDFVFLVAWRGWAYMEEVLRNYPLSVDPGFRDRLRFISRFLSVLWLGLARERNTEVAKLTGWVHNAFASQS